MIGTARRTLLALGLLGATVLGATPSEAQGVAGRWSTTVARGMRNENGNITSEGSVTMRLEIKVEGETVTGTWGPAEPPPANTPAAGPLQTVRAVKGTIKGNALAITAEAQQARIRMNDEESVIQLIPTFTLTLEGDTLKGSYQLVPADGHEGMPAMPFTATRVKG